METLSEVLARICDLVVWEGQSSTTPDVWPREYLCVRPDLFGVGSFAHYVRGDREWLLRTAATLDLN